MEGKKKRSQSTGNRLLNPAAAARPRFRDDAVEGAVRGVGSCASRTVIIIIKIII